MVHVSEGQLQTAGGLSCGNEDDDDATLPLLPGGGGGREAVGGVGRRWALES